jgi:NitT/TauT family transport system ATP-binding protein
MAEAANADPTRRTATNGAPVVTLQNVNKTFPNGVSALEQFGLDVRPGEFLSLVGPSGCGKSTALRLVAGLSAPTSGRIAWSGTAAQAERTRAIGFVFQEPTLMPWATVFGNVYLPLRLAGVPRAAAKPQVMEALAGVGLAEFAGVYPRELSGGMRMRVSIARALVTRPRLLLMDEPFAALDEITRFKLNDDLLALWHRLGKTIVFVTHSVFESVYLSQRVAVMTPRPGRVFTEIAIDAPQPRDRSFRTSGLYAEFCRITSDGLARAMAPDGAGQPA